MPRKNPAPSHASSPQRAASNTAADPMHRSSGPHSMQRAHLYATQATHCSPLEHWACQRGAPSQQQYSKQHPCAVVAGGKTAGGVALAPKLKSTTSVDLGASATHTQNTHSETLASLVQVQMAQHDKVGRHSGVAAQHALYGPTQLSHRDQAWCQGWRNTHGSSRRQHSNWCVVPCCYQAHAWMM